MYAPVTYKHIYSFIFEFLVHLERGAVSCRLLVGLNVLE